MTPLPRGLAKGILLAVGQVFLIVGLGGKLLLDRWTLPRGWARVTPVDPALPLRGRYLQLQLTADGATGAKPVTLEIVDGTVRARPVTRGTGLRLAPGPDGTFVLAETLAFFVPEDARDPIGRAPGEELWAEVTLPRQGPPRPIRLGVRTAGVLTPLELD